MRSGFYCTVQYEYGTVLYCTVLYHMTTLVIVLGMDYVTDLYWIRKMLTAASVLYQQRSRVESWIG
jgi:hypothetical protein